MDGGLMRRALFLSLLALALSAPATASAQSYGGSTLNRAGRLGSSVSLLVSPGGRIDGRVGMGYRCGKQVPFLNVVIRLGGASQGAAFTASGSKRMTRHGRLRVRMRGTFAGDRATGRITFRPSRMGRSCRRFSRRIALRVDRVPAGGPLRPAGRTKMHGVTGQAAGGVRLPVSLHVLRGGRRLVALWQANMRCGPKAVFTVVNFTPFTRIRRDGTFVRRERYRIRFSRNLVETFRVVIRGRFLADGAVGTVRARMRIRQPGKRFYPCDSGVQRWTASP
jgi:hypothetical protein